MIGGMTFHLHTYGCQMNVRDSEAVEALLSAADMARDAQAAEKRLVGSDPGLARSVTLAARL